MYFVAMGPGMCAGRQFDTDCGEFTAWVLMGVCAWDRENDGIGAEVKLAGCCVATLGYIGTTFVWNTFFLNA